eukprot:TRINITY_DN6037_c0_g1_i1.p1 TRINITY_DN6037_c0_g1~~TRINITY_DN6037_c0_g1_i1.p1  ORF type:complete len:510 (+),score=108.31 TRINITY_DN6037_c0_g1_i1:59-1588(+)
MSTLADTFLLDFGDDVNGGATYSDEEEGQEQKDDEMETDPAVDAAAKHQADIKDFSALFPSASAQDAVTILKYSDVKKLSKLRTSERLTSLLARLDIASSTPESIPGVVAEDDPEYQFIVECNNILVEITNEISKIHKFIQDLYAKKFPELESLVLNPLDYARVVRKIANETDLTLVDLSDILPAATIMVVTTASTTSGKPLEPDAIAKVLEACDEALLLDGIKQKILAFVESRMSSVAPNVSAIVGSSIAAQLIGVAGGLAALSRIPSTVIQALGSKKKTLSGFASSSLAVKHAGFIGESELLLKTPPSLRTRACRLVAGKCTLAARVDSFHESPDGEVGRNLRYEIEKKIAKWQEPPPPKQAKPLPAPDDKVRKRRGGKRYRKMKEKYQTTELRKHANRVAFGVQEETYRDTSKGFGMIGNSGKVRQSIFKGLNRKKLNKNPSSGSTSGLSSSLAFTPAQGLELENPMASAAKVADANKRYFGNTTFVKVNNMPPPPPPNQTFSDQN